ncbi:MAG: glycosyltransferase family 39 protein [Candidatus Brocadiales bacterium]|nr:glycosyltransferase family 39 protein [Candidatus Bathyanammoxibius sp.]
MNKKSPPWRLLLLLMLGALLLRVAALFILGRHHTPELWEYENIANNILAGRGYVYDSHLGVPYYSMIYPGYTYFCALVYALTGHSYTVLTLVQALLSSLTVGLLVFLGFRLGDPRGAWIAGGLAAVHPGLIIYSGKLHEFTLLTILIYAAVLLWSRWEENPQWWRYVLLGLLIGLGTHIRPTFLMLLPAWVVAQGVIHRPPWHRLVGRVLLLTGATVLALAPWTVRNYRIHGRFVFISTSSAVNFWKGNNPLASGSSYLPSGKPVVPYAASPSLRKALQTMTELEQYDTFYREAWSYIKKAPKAFLERWITKFYYFWWFHPQMGIEYPSFWLSLYKAFYIPILAMAGLGLPTVWRGPKEGAMGRRKLLLALLTFALLLSVTQSLFYVEGRHRWAVEPILLLLAGQAVANLWRWWSLRKLPADG